MTPVPPKAKPGPKPKYRYDKVKPDKPLRIRLEGKDAADIRGQIATIRANSFRWAKRNGIRLVTRLLKRGDTEATIEVHWEGRRK